MITFRPADEARDLPAMAHLLRLTMPQPPTAERVREWWRGTAGQPRRTRVAVGGVLRHLR